MDGAPELDLGATRISPFRTEDADALAMLGSDPEVARQMTSIPHPFTARQAAERIARAGWHGGLCFLLAVRDAKDRLLGEIGMGSEAEPSVMIWLGRAHRRQGHGLRALEGFTGEMFRRFPFPALIADAWSDNPASIALLHRAGFVPAGEGTAPATPYHPAGPIRLFRMERRP